MQDLRATCGGVQCVVRWGVVPCTLRGRCSLRAVAPLPCCDAMHIRLQSLQAFAKIWRDTTSDVSGGSAGRIQSVQQGPRKFGTEFPSQIPPILSIIKLFCKTRVQVRFYKIHERPELRKHIRTQRNRHAQKEKKNLEPHIKLQIAAFEGSRSMYAIH